MRGGPRREGCQPRYGCSYSHMYPVQRRSHQRNGPTNGRKCPGQQLFWYVLVCQVSNCVTTSLTVMTGRLATPAQPASLLPDESPINPQPPILQGPSPQNSPSPAKRSPAPPSTQPGVQCSHAAQPPPPPQCRPKSRAFSSLPPRCSCPTSMRWPSRRGCARCTCHLC